MHRGSCSVCIMLPACWLSVFTFCSSPKWIMQSSTLGGNRNSSSHQRTAGNQCTTAGCACRLCAMGVCVSCTCASCWLCVCVCGCESLCIFILVYEHLIGSVFVGVCMCEFYPLPYFIFARSLCMYVSFSFLSASQPALPLIGKACWMTQHHTLRDSLSAG